MSFAITSMTPTGYGAFEEQPASHLVTMYLLQIARDVRSGNLSQAQQSFEALERQVRSVSPATPLSGPTSSSVYQYLSQLQRAVDAGEVSAA